MGHIIRLGLPLAVPGRIRNQVIKLDFDFLLAVFHKIFTEEVPGATRGISFVVADFDRVQGIVGD